MAIDVKRASRETLEEIALLSDDYWKDSGGCTPGVGARTRSTLTKLRAECEQKPLRTRSEVDSEIVFAARDYFGATVMSGQGSRNLHDRLTELANEPTRPDPAPEPMTEAERDLCDYFASGRQWQSGDIVTGEGAELANALRDERRKRAPVYTEEPRHRDLAPPNRDQCGCEEVERLREYNDRQQRLLQDIRAQLDELNEMVP